MNPEKKSAATPSATVPKGRALEPHEILTSPEAQALARMDAFSKWAGAPDMSAVIADLIGQAKKAKGGDLGRLERMLYAQAATLDTMFTSLARRAAAQDHLPQFQAHMTLALKAQAQCRSTIEALAEIKNPKPVAFVKQANIAHQQQVNNGEAALPTPAPAQLAPPASDALADTWTQTSEPVPASRARGNAEARKAE